MSQPPIVMTRILRPRRRADLLRRPRLLDALHEQIDRKLLLVSVSAGYGKTSLLIDFAYDTDVPVCWYSLHETDRDMRVFVEYLIASIRQQFPAFGQRSQAFLANTRGALDPGSLANMLVNDIHADITDYFLIVLDDYHRGESESTNFLLDSLLQNLPDNCHIIVSSRATPRITPKSMALLIARREVAGLGTNDLRFDAGEIQALLSQNFKQHLPLEQAERLSRESEGWITGILLTTHSMWKGIISNIVEARGSSSKVYEYLANEVFSQQTPELQSFMRGSAVLDEMSPALCNQLLGRRDARQMLAALEERNLFVNRIERDNESWYRYHNLFQQFLLTKAEESGELADLHGRAGALLEAEDDLPQAIRHYMEARRHGDAARVVLRAAPVTFERNHWETLAAWIDPLSADVQDENPRLLWYRATAHSQLSEMDQALTVFNRADAAFKRGNDTIGLADVLIYRSIPQRLTGRFVEAEQAARQALTLLGDIEPTREIAASRATAYRTIGICQVQLGNLSAGMDELRRALALSEEMGDRYNAAHVHSDLGAALRMAGNMAAADLHFDQAIVLWQALGNSAALANTLNNVAYGHHLRGQYAKALEVYERAHLIAQEVAQVRVQGIVLSGMGDVYRDLGQHDQAFAAYNEARTLAERAQEAWLVSYVLDALGNTYILTGDFVRANELIRQAYEQARERRSRQAATLYFASLGILSYERGEPRTAIDYLAEAVRVLSQIGAKRELPKVRLHLGYAYYLNGQWDAAGEALDGMLEDVFAFGHDQYLEPIGRRMLPFLQFAQRKRPNSSHLRDFVERCQKVRLTSAPEILPGALEFVATPKLRIFALGEPRVFRGDSPVDAREWGTARSRELLFYLLANPHRSKEQIGATFWPELSVAKVRSAFHVTIYRLRRAIGVADAVLYDGDRYYFNQRVDFWYDVQEFERLLMQADRAAQSDPNAQEALLKQSVALYRGDYLENLPLSGEEWHTAQAEALRRKYVQCLLTLARLAAQRGQHEESLQYYQRLARRDSYLEAAHRGIMQAYVSMGDRNAALRHYSDFRTHLQRELGVAPTKETAGLYEEILRTGVA